MKTNMENYEERFVDYMEGQLDAAEMKEVEAFVAQHPELEEDFKLFCATKLEPDQSIVFSQKDSLMKKKAVVIPLFGKIMAVAASIALLIGIGVHFMNDQKPSHMQVALINGLAPKTIAKIEVAQTPLPQRPSSLKVLPSTKPASKSVKPELPARSEVIPTLASIKSSAIQWKQESLDDQMNIRIEMDLEQYLAAMNPVIETESSEDFAEVEDFAEEEEGESSPRFQKLGSTLYKRTAKTVLTAYYTADCYFNEAKRAVRR